jgi:hypothetical protein
MTSCVTKFSYTEVPEAPQTLPGISNSQRVTGLEPGVSYIFTLTPVQRGVRGPEASVTQNPGIEDIGERPKRTAGWADQVSNLAPSCSMSPWPGGRGVLAAYHSRQCSPCRICEADPGAAGVCTWASWATGCPGVTLRQPGATCLWPPHPRLSPTISLPHYRFRLSSSSLTRF